MLTGSNLLAQQAINLRAAGQFANLANISIADIVSALITMVLIIAAIIFFFMLVLGGIRYITSGGDKAGAEAARGQITAAIIGLAIVFAAWALVSLVQAFFGVNITELIIPNAQAPDVAPAP